LKKPPVIIPILRAALGMSGALEDVLQDASIGHIGVYRDEKTHLPVEYLVKLPDLKDRDIYLVDPMLATGHSAAYAMKILEQKGADMKRIKFMGLIAAPEGIQTFLDAYPNTPLYFASLDRQLNEKAYILPGLGDAGDRLLGTQ
ncbi:MAG: uracil phosphoribosyltransferase, partial [Pseudobdellovibrionaceae bacterium]